MTLPHIAYSLRVSPAWLALVEMGGDVARIFISYQRNAEDDEMLSRLLRERLAGEHQVFTDKKIAPGTE